MDHRSSDPRVASCLGCLAWGYGFIKGLCEACRNFARRWPPDECDTCQRRLPVKKGHCRLCWCQARLDRCHALGAAGTFTRLLPYVRRVRHQQLFLANLPAPIDLVGKALPQRRGVGTGAPGIPRKPPPPAASRPRGDWLQPPLFDHTARDYQRIRIDLRSSHALNNPWLGWALHLAQTLAETRGFDPAARATLNRALAMLLANHTDGETIRYSDIRRALRDRGNSAGHVAHVLEVMGILTQDQPRAFDTWLEGKLHQIAPAITKQVRRWAQTLHDGGPRIKACQDKTVRLYVAALRPVLLAWSARHQHLREISRDEVLAQLATLHGGQRRSTVTALRSLFGWATTSGVIFRDPTRRLNPLPTEPPTRQPLAPDQITPTVKAATQPHTRLAVVLAAVHAARQGDIRNMQLSDIDIGERRLTIAAHTRPLDDLTRNALNDWLNYRRQRWPNTANPHLFISRETALQLGPVSHHWLTRILRGMPATLERLRIDRHLDEAIISGADPLHLTEVFGIGQNTALRYAHAARQLLQGSIEEHHIDHREHPEPR